MIALSSISIIAPEVVFKKFSKIVTAVAKGSVITKDAGVTTFANLATVESQKEKVIPIIFKELKKCPSKQLPQYTEKCLIAIGEKNKDEFIELIKSRMPGLEKESQIKRIKKALKTLEIA